MPKFVIQIVCPDKESAQRWGKVVSHLVDNQSEWNGDPPPVTELIRVIETGDVSEL